MSFGEALSAPRYEEFAKTFGVEVINSLGSVEMYLGGFVNKSGEVRPQKLRENHPVGWGEAGR
ncbi:MAG: hypothetical protein A4E57_03048 [Syntrophorhabdaceae bacterium PtaU1.Bin034]|jgi:acyl-coenzyme A synthetase/AMP-(fatty) acid ligase|nr:MAG: hypothetical protein A4E57_03048 [Syntrophorhabdaceae bacterium PtaU1.Bin034]